MQVMIFFLFIPSARPHGLVTCKFCRFIIYIGVYWVGVCDFISSPDV